MSLDHLVYAVPDLRDAIEYFADGLGVRPSAGGSHPGRGTRNALLSLGEGSYLEIIGPDEEQGEALEGRPFGVDGTHEPRLVAWAIRVEEIDNRRVRACAAGYDPGEIRPMSRAMPDGIMLEWRLSAQASSYPSAIPFLIEWGTTTHPSLTAGQGTTLLEFSAESPEPAVVKQALQAMAATLPVRPGPAVRLHAVLQGPGGVVELH